MNYKNVKSKLKIDNNDFLKEIILSKERDELTPKSLDYLIQITNHAINNLHYENYLDREDCIQAALHDVIKYWRNFDVSISLNPFAFFTQISKNAYAKEYKKIYRNRFLIRNSVYKFNTPISTIEDFVRLNKIIESKRTDDESYIKYFRFSKENRKFSDWFLYEVKFIDDFDDENDANIIEKMKELSTSLEEIINFENGPFYVQIKYEFEDGVDIISLDKSSNGNNIYTI